MVAYTTSKVAWLPLGGCITAVFEGMANILLILDCPTGIGIGRLAYPIGTWRLRLPEDTTSYS